MAPERSRRIEPSDPGGEPVCLLTADGVRERRVPIDRLLESGELTPLPDGYEIRLPPGNESWAVANAFADEEANCCPALTLEVAETETTVMLAARFSTA